MVLTVATLKKEAARIWFNEREKWRVEKFQSKSANSPFIGEELYGKVKYTICRGQIVYTDEEEKNES